MAKDRGGEPDSRPDAEVRPSGDNLLAGNHYRRPNANWIVSGSGDHKLPISMGILSVSSELGEIEI